MKTEKQKGMSNTNEIIEGNKLIAEFMGGSIKENLTVNGYTQMNLPWWAFEVFDFDKLRVAGYDYHKSWDWLMPVIEKIHKMGKMISINFYSDGNSPIECRIYNWVLGGPQHAAESSISIQSCWLAVIDFIKWYNENKSSL